MFSGFSRGLIEALRLLAQGYDPDLSLPARTPAQKRVVQALRELVTLHARKTEAWENAAHEVRTGLTLLSAHAQELSDPAWFAGEITRLSALLSPRLSEKPPSPSEIAFPELDMLDFLTAAAAWIAPGAPLLRLQVDCPPGLRWALDPLLLRQLVVNLSGNALKYLSPGCTLTFRAREEESARTLEIFDDGPGFDPSLFSPGASTSGSGRGLPIVTSLADTLGATLSFQGHPGAHFTLTWPPGC